MSEIYAGNTLVAQHCFAVSFDGGVYWPENEAACHAQAPGTTQACVRAFGGLAAKCAISVSTPDGVFTVTVTLGRVTIAIGEHTAEVDAPANARYASFQKALRQAFVQYGGPLPTFSSEAPSAPVATEEAVTAVASDDAVLAPETASQPSEEVTDASPDEPVDPAVGVAAVQSGAA